MTLGDMLRHERSGAGMADQRNLDAELARAITTDGKFEVGFSNNLKVIDTLILLRMTSNTWMTMPKGLAAKRCARTQ